MPTNTTFAGDHLYLSKQGRECLGMSNLGLALRFQVMYKTNMLSPNKAEAQLAFIIGQRERVFNEIPPS